MGQTERRRLEICWREIIPTLEDMRAIEAELAESEIIPGITDRFILENWAWPYELFEGLDEPVEGS